LTVALVFAGGRGERMGNPTCPKQFLKLYGKPVIIYTLEIFEKSPSIDRIVVACLQGWEDFLSSESKKYGISKLWKIVNGGPTSLLSKKNALDSLANVCDRDELIVFHDAVRPLINVELVEENIKCAIKYGNCVTIESFNETGAILGDDFLISSVMPREKIVIARAPQVFRYGDVMDVLGDYEKLPNFVTIDLCSIMCYHGVSLHTVQSSPYNIKITTPEDFYIFKAMVDMDNLNEVSRR